MATYGMPVLDVLRSATSVDARVLHMGTQIGRVEPNFLADLLVVQGDPSQSIAALRQVKVVMKDGRIVRR
jgi:imidazolonepropionase-like amidohydrolase